MLADQQRIHGYVNDLPGSKAEQIGAALGLNAVEMRVPIAKLLDEAKIKKTGQRRATKYFPGKK